MGTLAQVGVWLSVAVFMVAAAFLLAWLRSPAWLKTRPAPSGNHPAARALAARKTWVDEQGDPYTAVVPVAEVESPCTCPPDDAATIADLEARFTVVEQSRARASNRELLNLPYRSQS